MSEMFGGDPQKWLAEEKAYEDLKNQYALAQADMVAQERVQKILAAKVDATSDPTAKQVYITQLHELGGKIVKAQYALDKFAERVTKAYDHLYPKNPVPDTKGAVDAAGGPTTKDTPAAVAVAATNPQPNVPQPQQTWPATITGSGAGYVTVRLAGDTTDLRVTVGSTIVAVIGTVTIVEFFDLGGMRIPALY